MVQDSQKPFAKYRHRARPAHKPAPAQAQRPAQKPAAAQTERPAYTPAAAQAQRPAYKPAAAQAESAGARPANVCPNARKCAGCQLQNMDYAQQLLYKQGQMRRLVGRFGNIHPILGMKQPLYYRNKVQTAFRDGKDGRVVSGVYQSASKHVIPAKSCMIEDRASARIAGTMRQLMTDLRIPPCNPATGVGLVRQLLVRRAFATGQLMVVIVTSSPILPAKNRLVEGLLKAHPQITTILHNINTDYDGLMLGSREQALYGPGYIEDILCGQRFRISARSFYQVNPVQTERLYNRALEMARLNGTQTVLDAYCGIGTIALTAAPHAAKVVGVEINRAAVQDAQVNAELNGAAHASFLCADAADWLAQGADGLKADVAFLDPPRAGCDKRMLLALARMAPARIVYISCSPETLARDLLILTGHGYAVEEIQPVDLFPYTRHIECVVSLTAMKQKAL